MTAILETRNSSLPSVFEATSPPVNLHEAYQSLPDLLAAADLVTDQVLKEIHGSIRQVFYNHELNEKYGLCLLHRHFPIEANHRLVEHGPCSSPWQVGPSQDFVAPMPGGVGFVQPRSYRFVNDIAVPYEFGYTVTKPTVDDLKEDAAFFNDMRAVLKQHGLQDLLGVRVLENMDDVLTLEITQGTSNIMVHPGDMPVSDKITASWMFREVFKTNAGRGKLPNGEQYPDPDPKDALATECVQSFCSRSLHSHTPTTKKLAETNAGQGKLPNGDQYPDPEPPKPAPVTECVQSFCSRSLHSHTPTTK